MLDVTCHTNISMRKYKWMNFFIILTHWGRVTHIRVGKLTISGSCNGLSPGRCQAIIWTNAGILLIGLLGTNFSENPIWTQTFSFKKMHLKMSAKWRPFCLELNVLIWIMFRCLHAMLTLALCCNAYPYHYRHLLCWWCTIGNGLMETYGHWYPKRTAPGWGY